MLADSSSDVKLNWNALPRPYNLARCKPVGGGGAGVGREASGV